MRDKLLVCSVALILLSSWSLFVSPAAASVSASPASVNFGSVNVNSPSSPTTIVLTNNYDRSATIETVSVSASLSQFIVTGPSLPLTLQSHQSVSFQIVFDPSAASVISGNVTFTVRRRSTSTLIVPVTGTGVALPTSTYLLLPSSTNISFANTLVGNSSSQSITLSNTGNSSVTISQISITGVAFTGSGIALPFTLAAGQSVSLSVAFSPAAVGTSAGAITVVSNATNSPATISLSATGVQPQITVVPTGISFGSVTDGVTNTQTVTVKNSGTANLTVTQATITGNGFTGSGISLPLTLAPGASSTFTLSFTPTTASTSSGFLTLISNAQTSSLSVPLSGAGVAQVQQLSTSATSLSFGSQTLSTSASQPVTITNTGNSSVTISQVSVTGTGFSFSGLTAPLTLTAGQSTSFNTIFDPTTAGNFTGTATIASNATNSPQSIALSGSGAAPVTHSVSLSWQPSTSSVVGYNVYEATSSGGPFTKLNSTPTASTTYSDTSVVSGDTYYFVTTAVASSGDESTYSNQAVAVVP
ncbi:MAG TPA: choice-of-anchor D domain-containing protein [Candidatus Acidoferrum sp.]|jgi:hypothetical protein